MNIKMKVTNFLWLVFCLAHSLGAQEGFVSSGGDISSANGSVAYSIGQIAYSSINGETGNINEGLQQPILMDIVSIGDLHQTYSLQLFPNPSNQLVYIRLTMDEAGTDDGNLFGKLYDIEGHFLLSQKLTAEINPISIGWLPTGLYVIQVWRSNTLIQSISFYKTN